MDKSSIHAKNNSSGGLRGAFHPRVQAGSSEGTATATATTTACCQAAGSARAAANPSACRCGCGACRRGEVGHRPGFQGLAEGYRHREAECLGQGQGSLHWLDDQRQDVRQLGPARPALGVSAQRRHQGLDRRPAADGGGRETAFLDPGQSGLWRYASASGRPSWNAGV